MGSGYIIHDGTGTTLEGGTALGTRVEVYDAEIIGALGGLKRVAGFGLHSVRILLNNYAVATWLAGR